MNIFKIKKYSLFIIRIYFLIFINSYFSEKQKHTQAELINNLNKEEPINDLYSKVGEEPINEIVKILFKESNNVIHTTKGFIDCLLFYKRNKDVSCFLQYFNIEEEASSYDNLKKLKKTKYEKKNFNYFCFCCKQIIIKYRIKELLKEDAIKRNKQNYLYLLHNYFIDKSKFKKFSKLKKMGFNNNDPLFPINSLSFFWNNKNKKK
jgi:hypothetical protein